MKIAVLPGDDIGPEIVDATLAVLEVVDRRYQLGIRFDVHEVGMAAHRRCGTTLPDKALEGARGADGIILGPGGMTEYPPLADGGINIPGTIRKNLVLYANIRPARSRANVARAVPGLDCVIVRENTEGFYADRNLYSGYGEMMPTKDTALSLRVITAEASRRIGRMACQVAQERSGKITLVGKRHVLQVTDGLFMREVAEAAKEFPGVQIVEIDIDAMAADLYLRPERHDVILTSNMYGDILSNQAVALSGALGLACALNAGDEHAAANAGHGSAPDIAGKGIANPTGIILSSALLLNWLGKRHGSPNFQSAARAIEAAVDDVIGLQTIRTPDLSGSATTKEFTQAVMRVLDAPDLESR